MKSIKNIIKTSAMMMTGAIALTSCTDDNDWGIDSAFDRLFGTQNISVDAADTHAEITFDTNSEAQAYVIELNTDSLYEDEVNATSIVDTVTGSPATITGLDGNTKYYLRLKNIAEGKNDSKWKYYKTASGNGYFHTDAEQIFTEITDDDRGEDSIRLAWTPAGTKVTNIQVLNIDSTEVQNVTLDATAVSNGTYTVKNLKPSTTYIFKIFNGSTCRGITAAATAAAMPAADYKYTLPASVTVLSTEVLQQIYDQAKAKTGESNPSVTIGILGGSVIDAYGTDAETGDQTNVEIPAGMSVTFFGLAGAKPIINIPKAFDISGSHAFITFNNVVLNGQNDYFINQSAACTVSEFNLTDVEAYGMKKAFFRLQGSNSMIIDKMNIGNSIFHDMLSGYSFIHVDAGSGAGVVNNLSISYSTFYNVAEKGKMFIYSKNTNMKSLVIDHITMYNSIGNNQYLVDFGSTSYGADKFEINNSIFSAQPDAATKNIRAAVKPTPTNTYCTNDFYKEIGGTQLDKSATDIFEDPAIHNFNIKVGSLNGAGDTYHWTVTAQ